MDQVWGLESSLNQPLLLAVPSEEQRLYVNSVRITIAVSQNPS